MLINNHNLRILKVFYIFWLFLIDLIHGYYYFAFLIVIILHHMMVYHHYMTDIIIYIYITMYRNNMYNYIYTIYYFIYIFIIIVLSGIHRYDSVSSSLSVFQVALRMTCTISMLRRRLRLLVSLGCLVRQWPWDFSHHLTVVFLWGRVLGGFDHWLWSKDVKNIFIFTSSGFLRLFLSSSCETWGLWAVRLSTNGIFQLQICWKTFALFRPIISRIPTCANKTCSVNIHTQWLGADGGTIFQITDSWSTISLSAVH